MSFIKQRFNRVFNTKISTNNNNNKQNKNNNYNIQFCDREIHDPLYDCCFAYEIDRIQSGAGGGGHCNHDGGGGGGSWRFSGRTSSSTTSSSRTKTITPPTRKNKNKTKKQTSNMCSPSVISSHNYSSSCNSTRKVFPVSPANNTNGNTPTESTSNFDWHNKSIFRRFRRRRNCRHPRSQTTANKCSNRPSPSPLSSSKHQNATDEQYQNLCDSFDGISICGDMMTPRLTKLYPTIPEHDKKILKRMALKRSKELAHAEESKLAHAYWDYEKQARQQMIEEHTTQLTNFLRSKRAEDSKETKQRLQNLANEHERNLNKIKEDITQKQQRQLERIRMVELKKHLKKYERQQNELRKFQITANNLIIAANLENKQQCYNQLDSRISRAVEARAHHLDAYRRKTNSYNEMQQTIHAANYEEVQRFEKLKLEMLKSQINERDTKFRQFLCKKLEKKNISKEQARATSELRDIIRRSISPDTSLREGGIIKWATKCITRPISNMSIY